MSIRRIMNMRFCLSFGLAMGVTTMLVTHRGAPVGDLEGPGIVVCVFPVDLRHSWRRVRL